MQRSVLLRAALSDGWRLRDRNTARSSLRFPRGGWFMEYLSNHQILNSNQAKVVVDARDSDPLQCSLHTNSDEIAAWSTDAGKGAAY